MELLGCPSDTGVGGGRGGGGGGGGGGAFLLLGKDDVGNGGGTGTFSGIVHILLSLQTERYMKDNVHHDEK